MYSLVAPLLQPLVCSPMDASRAAAAAAGHRYWRIYINTNQNATQAALAEIEFRGTVGGADLTGSGTASASSIYGAEYNADKAFDNDNSTIWHAAGAVPDWVAYDFATPVSVAQVMLRARTDGGGGNQAPASFDVQYSDNGTDYTTALAVTGQSGWTAGEVRTFNIV